MRATYVSDWNVFAKVVGVIIDLSLLLTEDGLFVDHRDVRGLAFYRSHAKRTEGSVLTGRGRHGSRIEKSEGMPYLYREGAVFDGTDFQERACTWRDEYRWRDHV